MQRKRRGRWFRRILALALACGCGTAAGADDRRADQAVLSIMTLDANFLWDGEAPEEGSAEFPWKGNVERARAHMRQVAELIRASDPDIVNVVGVENAAALVTFNSLFLAEQRYRSYLIDGQDSVTGQDVALLTRVDPDRMGRDDRLGQSGAVAKSVSKNYFATFTVGELRIALIGLHLLSTPWHATNGPEREAQADAMRRLALELRAEGYQVIILGGLNDYDGSLESRDHIGSLPSTRALAILRRMDPAMADDDLVNAARFLSRAERFTAFYDANQNGRVDPPWELTGIDHVLLSAALAARVDSVQVPRHPDTLAVSSHYPVVVRLLTQALPMPRDPPPPAPVVMVASLLPNPAGNERLNEEATIINVGTRAANLAGWRLRDPTGSVWRLDAVGVLEPGQAKVFRRNGQPMGLNNDGDLVELVDAAGVVVDRVAYGRAREGERLPP